MPRPRLLLQLADKEKEAQINAPSGVGFVCKVEGSRQEDGQAGGVAIPWLQLWHSSHYKTEELAQNRADP